MKKLRHCNFEQGQGTVEFALVIVILIPLLFAIIDFGWIGYQYITFDYSYQMSSWELSVDESDSDVKNYSPKYVRGYKAVNSIRNGMLENSYGLKQENLNVYNAQIKLWTDVREHKYPAYYQSAYETSTSYYRKMIITANIEYLIEPVTFFGQSLFHDGIVVKKQLIRERLKSMVS